MLPDLSKVQSILGEQYKITFIRLHDIKTSLPRSGKRLLWLFRPFLHLDQTIFSIGLVMVFFMTESKNKYRLRMKKVYASGCPIKEIFFSKIFYAEKWEYLCLYVLITYSRKISTKFNRTWNAKQINQF